MDDIGKAGERKVTAKEMREGGVQIPLDVPDEAWIYRKEINYRIDETKSHREGDEQVLQWPVEVNAEWRMP